MVKEVIDRLHDGQRLLVESIGFGSLLKMEAVKLDKEFYSWLVDNFGVEHICLNANGKSIKLTNFSISRSLLDAVCNIESLGLYNWSKYMLDNLVNGIRCWRKRNARGIGGYVLFLKGVINIQDDDPRIVILDFLFEKNLPYGSLTATISRKHLGQEVVSISSFLRMVLAYIVPNCGVYLLKYIELCSINSIIDVFEMKAGLEGKDLHLRSSWMMQIQRETRGMEVNSSNGCAKFKEVFVVSPCHNEGNAVSISPIVFSFNINTIRSPKYHGPSVLYSKSYIGRLKCREAMPSHEIFERPSFEIDTKQNPNISKVFSNDKFSVFNKMHLFHVLGIIYHDADRV
ncbi:hypothetical protein ACH5RR_018603 [Cinchona calisaya]|uniref:Uncharacterized protein n=1 Tax=Cinchona calisaya TaxID=153742 RepID=A0ABD2ZLX5_9GENT